MKQFILQLAHRSIEYYFQTNKILEISEEEIPSEELKQERSCFITLQLNGQLRGCIGHIEPTQELYKDIIENAVSAAFHDPRFSPLTQNEYKQINIEISILTKPEKLEFTDSQDLLNKLRPNIDGVIIRYNSYSSTYLPQVWEDLSDKEEFLASLCLKAGLSTDSWKEKGVEVYTYQVEIIK